MNFDCLPYCMNGWLVSYFVSQLTIYSPSSFINYLHAFPLSDGSIVTEGELQFSNGSKPNTSDLKQVLINGSFSFTIITNSITTAEVTEPAGQCVFTDLN